MGFLGGMIKSGISKGISEGVSKAVGQAVQKTIAPKAEELANKAAQSLDQAAKDASKNLKEAEANLEEANRQIEAAGGAEAIESALSALEKIASASIQDKKVCEKCGQLVDASNKFCPICGEELPEFTIAESCVCPKCGKQNALGAQYCTDCGAVLPIKAAAEKALAKADAEVLASFPKCLPDFPAWTGGGKEYDLSDVCDYDDGSKAYIFTFWDASNESCKALVDKYVEACKADGFGKAYEKGPSDHLYKKKGDKWLHIDLEHLFEGDDNSASIAFGFDKPYIPEAPKKVSTADTLNDLKNGIGALKGLFK